MKTCKECKHYRARTSHCEKGAPWITIGTTSCKNFEQKSKMTNGDVLKQSNRELAKFLSEKVMCVACPMYPNDECQGTANAVCRKKWLAYLDAPAEREVEDV